MTPEVREALKRHKFAIVGCLKAAGQMAFQKGVDNSHLRPLPLVSGQPLDHYPELKCRCGHWWDYLPRSSKPQCRARRDGRVLDP